MKVILNKDLAPLGEEGDVRDVAKGYARNYLFPRGIALPYNESTIKLFESRREAIEVRKAQKRTDAAGLREKLESLNLEIAMPAGANGKLYGAVTSHTIMEELAKLDFQIERKRIDLAGTSLKSVGKYKAVIKLYESASAEINITIIGQEIKTESKASPSRIGRKRRDERGQRDDQHESPEAEAVPSDVHSTESPAGGEVRTEAAADLPSASGASAEEAGEASAASAETAENQ